ncbi:MAG TPA: DUF4124 domain-containing protein [Steroidobacteraceae bacterium]|nr:DUF4124 domain-containing protein [Steroidobacteraceae bacterium]
MSRSIVILLAASAVLVAAAGLARADEHVVYEWTDAQGQVHYTDQWKPGAKLIRVETANQAASDPSAMQGIQNESNAASRDVKQDADAQAVQEDVAKARATQCARDKVHYQQLIQSRRLFTTGKSGERHYLSDADADALRVKARQAMEADCGASSTP